MPQTEYAIQLEHVTKTFGPVIANHDVTMNIRRGEILSLLGENGSGKTTLMNMIAGIYYPDGGQIIVNGQPADIRSPRDALALGIGMIHQHFKLVDVLTASENIVLGLKEKGRLNPQVAAQVTIRILSALQHAHQNGIIHRDIKPQNILVNADGHVKVADFGIARMADSSTLTRGDSVMGSVHYFSPEQASGQAADARSDIYSCGVVLYEMLTGRVPFDGDSPVAVAMQHLHAKPAPIESIAPDVPQAISHVCMMAMEKNPKYRYQSAMEMAAELRLALEGRTERMQPRLVEAMLQGNELRQAQAVLVEAGEKKNAVKAAALRLKKLLQGEERP